jgi:predicted porin
MQPNVSDQGGAAHGDSSTPLNRQAYLSFGDKSWGSIKLGKDIGIFASDAILNDMTLLGVGAGAMASGGATTLGGIGSGYIYAAWKGQATYTTPNFNGFQASVGLFNPNQASKAAGLGHDIVAGAAAVTAGTAATPAGAALQDRLGLEGKISYAFSADNFTGKIWASGASYDITYNAAGAAYSASVADLGANINAGNVGLTGYYYSGEGVGTTILGQLGSTSAGAKRDSDGGYLQATYILPTKTKLGLAYGISKLDAATGDTLSTLVKENERMTLGLYHPLTKHLNLVAEYNDVSSKTHTNVERDNKTGSLGAILFF